MRRSPVQVRLSAHNIKQLSFSMTAFFMAFSVVFVVCLNHKYKNKMGLNLIIGKGEEAV